MYTALAVIQNAAKALSDVSACEGLKRLLPKMSGAKTMTFLIQCFGRRRATAAGTIMCRVMWRYLSVAVRVCPNVVKEGAKIKSDLD
jgi:hypothetical protein